MKNKNIQLILICLLWNITSYTNNACNSLYDVIIVGMGTSGSVLANRLTEDPTLNVLVIESGRDDTRLPPLLPVDLPYPMPNKVNNPWSILPRLSLSTYGQNLAQGFTTWQHTPLFRNDPSSNYVFYPRGSTWGGCTIQNAGIGLRGFDTIYDQWATFFPNNIIWSYQDILPYFKKAENRSQTSASFDAQLHGARFYQPAPIVPNGLLGNFDPRIHGDSGPLQFMYFDVRDPSIDSLGNAIKDAVSNYGPYYPGYPIAIDVDPDAQEWRQWLTSHNEVAYDQFSQNFSLIDPYKTGPVGYPATFGPFSGNIPRMQRCHAAAAYIYPVLYRPNLTIISEALATKIIFDNKKRAIGVQYLKHESQTWNIYQAGRQMNTSRAGIGGTPTDAQANAAIALQKGFSVARASKEIIVCGGVFNSPQLLLLSGIGPKEDLQALGINVVCDLPGVGKHLVDHPELEIIWQHDTPWNNNAFTAAKQLAQSGFWTLSFKSDSLQPFADCACNLTSNAPTHWGADGDFLEAYFDSPSQGVAAARYDCPPQYIYPVGYTNYPTSQRFDPPLNPLFVCSATYQLRANIKSEGFVKLRSTNPTDSLYIVTNFLQNPDDMQTFIAGFRDTLAPILQHIQGGYFTSWLRPLPSEFLTFGNLLLPDKSNFNQAAFEQFILQRTWGHHGVGTCKMGPATDASAVTNVRGQVYGVTGLRVCDCSICPIIPTSNTATPAYMIGERMADLIKEDLAVQAPIKSINPFIDALVSSYGSNS